MNEKFAADLLEGEQLLWTGAPEACKAMDKTHKSIIVTRIIITLVIVAAACAVMAKQGNNTGIIVASIVIGLLVIIGPFTEVNKIKKIEYAATNQRLLCSLNGSKKAIAYSSIKDAAIKTDADGHTNFFFGAEAIATKPTQVRNIAALGPKANPDGTVCERFIMYGVPNPETLRDTLKNYISF